ncbi:C45 family autoproteolytic acyltransferase/hydolase [Mycobacterium aquaticum]|uniref:C45 family autoproteolytic acyltransferase/hydolase n=1 Tax=Mycobacterium aquaticum TaxID=1927124 RepID=UPI001301BB81|nr:C45 family peptidase [Mycobacterium aquaticum]
MSQYLTCSLSGTGRERGLSHGRQLAAEISGLYERYIVNGHGISPNSPEESTLLRRAESYWPAIQEFDNDLADELVGIAEGAELEFAKVLLLNCYDEFGLDPADGPAGHCTGVVLAPEATVSGATLLGQNWDIPRWYQPCVLFHVAEAQGQPEAFILSQPGIIGGPGMNQHIALCWMTVLPTDAVVGVPGSLLTRRALAMTSIDDALAVVLDAKRATGQNLFVANGRRGVNVETTAGTHHVTEVAVTWAHANHYKDEMLRALEIPGDPIWSSRSRLARMEMLLRRRGQSLGPEHLFDMLRDHEGYPGSICEHQEGENQAETLASIVMSPGEGKLFLSFGPPCSNSPIEMTLRPLDHAVK